MESIYANELLIPQNTLSLSIYFYPSRRNAPKLTKLYKKDRYKTCQVSKTWQV
jgi:hypothetical protein